MAISQTGVFRDTVGGKEYPLKLRNGEIERFEMQHAPLGLYELFDQLAGNGPAPQVRHVRDIVALGLVGGGMSDRAADMLIADLGPEHNTDLRKTAWRLVGATFFPVILDESGKKKPDGSDGEPSDGSPSPGTTSDPESETSAA
ncbi:GTA-gp10 family protein [Marinovum algicola]|uniref:GTA-gp10 family protein n=1 Tax=Marinovum algicola TaxID=42444 RepID=UPI003B52F0FF